VKIGILKETHEGEKRVAATPDTVGKLLKLGFEVLIESGAGEAAHLTDEAFADANARLVASAKEIWDESDLVLKVRPPTSNELGMVREGTHIISLFFPAQNSNLIDQLAAKKCTVIALDQIPRISRAQKMDVLSSMANIAGYRAVIEAANHFGSFFAGQITAAGRTRPAQVLVIGAGVAGLAAVAAARGLGAEVRAFDVRPAVKEQVESLGATFLELEYEEEEHSETKGGYAKEMSQAFLDAESALFAAQAKEVDIIITTALIPGKPAPKLITKAMVESMKPGSIVVDLAAEQGGNCAYTQPDRAVEVEGVTILGYTDLTSRLATHASQLFSTNIVNLLSDMVGDDGYEVDLEDEVVRKALVVHNGLVTWPPPPEPAKAIPPPPTQEAPQAPEPASPKAKPETGHTGGAGSALPVLLLVAILLAIGLSNPEDQLIHNLTVFALACFVGWQVVWSVKPALHTPLMSVTNAISGIIVVGGMLQVSVGEPGSVPVLLGAAAILVASINIAGGFLVTQRMLKMFRREGQ
jgi:NAD(P) transhydrogenase subunit alpha